jgi:hypothetical protein
VNAHATVPANEAKRRLAYNPRMTQDDMQCRIARLERRVKQARMALGNERLVHSVDVEGQPSITLLDDAGKPTWAIPK